MKPTYVAIFLLGVAGARAERITGVVTDATGAVFTNAIIDLTSDKRTEAVHTRTDLDGSFLINQVKPGSYDLTIQAEGFPPTILRAVTVVGGKDTALPYVRLTPYPPPSTVSISSKAHTFRIGSVRVMKLWTTSRGLPSIPYSLFDNAWKDHGIPLASGTISDRDTLYKAAAMIKGTFAMYGSMVDVLVETVPQVDWLERDNIEVAISYRVVELCQCH